MFCILCDFVIIACLLLLSFNAKAQLPVSDGFESKTLSRLWETDKFEKTAVNIQQQIVHSGQSALKITLHEGDKYEAGNDSSKESERAELTEARKLVSKEGNRYEYAFSMFIPKDFPIVPTRLVIAQWKQHCGQGICEDDSPVLALRYSSGIFQITIQTGPKKNVFYETKEDIRGKWLNFKFQTRFTRTDSGYINAWINDKQVIDYSGKTCYSAERGYGPISYFYFKMGLYRDKMPEPMTIYIDDYSKKQLNN